ncbi:hypothetical protein BTO30_06950 [Domibacillus antri]|uniref:Uncharacterized protein n=1 Tax=Domibacillus antri TaxID=1714264 RepID=A0A1Q8Q6L7_9BACI|nr:hypothetical protein [Domibacillus antri]OLN22987.1 hypothetical protein BTO30_06950 [Domibacillus antri]
MASKQSSFSNFDRLSSRDKLANKLSIGESGNSDVDVNVVVKVDTMPIAFAMLCSLWSSKQLSDEDFERAVERLEKLTGQQTNKVFFSDNELSNVKIFEKKRFRK